MQFLSNSDDSPFNFALMIKNLFYLHKQIICYDRAKLKKFTDFYVTIYVASYMVDFCMPSH